MTIETAHDLQGLLAVGRVVGQTLRHMREALRPGGLLAVWSSGPDAAFTRRLKQAGFGVEEVPTRANGKRGGARHMIWIAIRPGRAG